MAMTDIDDRYDFINDGNVVPDGSFRDGLDHEVAVVFTSSERKCVTHTFPQEYMCNWDKGHASSNQGTG